MENKAVQILDIVYFLVSKYGYEQIKLTGNQNEFWLFNPRREKYSLIRLSLDSMDSYRVNKDKIMNETKRLAELFKIEPSVLSIHFTDEFAEAYFEPGYMQAQINENVISPVLKDEFKGIEFAIKPVTEDIKTELTKRQEMFRKHSTQSRSNARKMTLKESFKMYVANFTGIIVLINFLVYFLGGILAIYTESESFRIVATGALYKPLVYGAYEWWRVITSSFVHVNIWHLLMNMVALWQVGVMVEKVYGKKQMLFIYFSSVITSSLLAVVATKGSYLIAGASGGIFGLMGAVVVYLFTSGLYKVPQVRTSIIRTLVLNLLISLIPTISMFGHLGGLIGGILAAMFVSKAKVLESAKISSIICLLIVNIGIVFYGVTLDEGYFPLQNKLDKQIVEKYDELGLKGYAKHLEKSFEKYYEVIGEEY